jgi:D-alanine-D-alanine ligase
MSGSAKIRVAVLRGGPSNEYEVSLKTGSNLLKHLQSPRMNERYLASDVLITRDGIWHLNGFELAPDKIIRQVDVVLNALHGQFGEDGKVQQMLESLGARYTGSGVVASAMAMNKQLTKEVAKRNGVTKSDHEVKNKSKVAMSLKHMKSVKTALHLVIKAGEDTPEKITQIFRTFPHPSVIKPISSGSSVGVSIAYTASDLREAVASALLHSDAVLIEEYIAGKEVTCGVIENFRGQHLYALPVIEIVPAKKAVHDDGKKGVGTNASSSKDAFFDYHAKYSGESSEICPGNFTEDERDAIQRAACEIHQALGLRHYSRADFIVSPRRGIYFLETNTLPGMTNESLFPKALAAVGADVPTFLEHIIGLAMSVK